MIEEVAKAVARFRDRTCGAEPTHLFLGTETAENLFAELRQLYGPQISVPASGRMAYCGMLIYVISEKDFVGVGI